MSWESMSDEASPSDLDALLSSEDFYQNPYPAYARLRADAPVFRQASSASWLVGRWDDVDTVLRAPSVYSSYGFNNAYFERLRPELRAVAPTLELRGRTPTLITSDPPEHTRLRRLLQTGFSPKAIAAMRPRIQAIVDELLCAFPDDGQPVDLVAAFAYPLPAAMIADILGVPREDRDLFKKVSSDIVRFGNRTDPNREITVAFAREADTSLRAFHAYLRDLIAMRRREPRDDVVSLLVRADFEGDALDEEEILFNLVLFLIAGHETTTALLASAVYLLASHPEQRALAVEDKTQLLAAVDEVLRFETPVQRLRRVVSEDVELGNSRIPAGEPIELMVGSANRDESRFDRPEEFNLTRSAGPSFSFGKGVHFCIGKSLALLEAEVALGTVFDRYPTLSTVPDWTPKWASLTNIRCLGSLPVTVS